MIIHGCAICECVCDLASYCIHVSCNCVSIPADNFLLIYFQNISAILFFSFLSIFYNNSYRKYGQYQQALLYDNCTCEKKKFKDLKNLYMSIKSTYKKFERVCNFICAICDIINCTYSLLFTYILYATLSTSPSRPPFFHSQINYIIKMYVQSLEKRDRKTFCK